MTFKLVTFRNLHVEANNLVDRKHGQEKAVSCLSEGRDVFPVMPTGYGKRFMFQLVATAVMIKRVHEGQRSKTVVLVTSLLTSVTQDQESLGLSLVLQLKI